ncbi:MAG: YesL family protein [Firmicutes bacterium]|nr:YesL family protein [Bacillota bacterium]
MGLFSNRYSKPGPGVGKDEPEKRRIVVFFEIFFRKFWKLEQINLLFLLLCIPILLLVFGLNMLMLSVLKVNNALLSNFVSFLPLGLLGIPLTGMTYITRNFAREEHAFIGYDFFDQIKKNWKQGLLHGMITYVLVFVAYYALTFYFAAAATRGWLFMIPGVLCLLLLMAFTFSQYYVFQMIITFELPYKNMLKNGLIFSIAAFLRNLLLTVLHVVVWGFTILLLATPETCILGILLLLVGTPAFSSFITNFVTYPVIVRYMIKPMYEKDEDGGQAASAKDTDHYHPIEEDPDKEEYVFENGRLIKKMDHVESVFEDRK